MIKNHKNVKTSSQNFITKTSHKKLQLLCWKTMLLLHTDPNLIDKSIGNRTFEQTIWLWNHTSHTKNTSMNLLQMPCVITWSWSFLTSKVVKAVRGQKHHILAYTFNSTFGSFYSASSAYQRFTRKWDQLWLSASIWPPFSLHISNSRIKPKGLDF